MIQMLIISPIDEPYAGLEPAIAALDPDWQHSSPAFQRRDDGYDQDEVLYASLAHLGTDDTVDA